MRISVSLSIRRGHRVHRRGRSWINSLGVEGYASIHLSVSLFTNICQFRRQTAETRRLGPSSLGHPASEQSWTSTLRVSRVVLITVQKQINLIRLRRQTRRSPGLHGSYLTTRGMEAKSFPRQIPRPLMCLAVLNMRMTSQVSVSDPCHHG